MNGDKISNSEKSNKKTRDCPLCFSRLPNSNFPRLINCSHRSCRNCLVKVTPSFLSGKPLVLTNRNHGITGDDCVSRVQRTPSSGRHLCLALQKSSTYRKIREFLHSTSPPVGPWYSLVPRTRLHVSRSFTSALENYRYAVIATSCAACPQLKCERPGCGTLFCYHCKGLWHSNQTCDEARRERGSYRGTHMPTSISSAGSLGQIQFNSSSADRDNLLKRRPSKGDKKRF